MKHGVDQNLTLFVYLEMCSLGIGQYKENNQILRMKEIKNSFLNFPVRASKASGRCLRGAIAKMYIKAIVMRWEAIVYRQWSIIKV